MAERRVERFKEKMTEEAQYAPYAERAVASVYRLRFTTNQLIRRAVQWFTVLMHIVEAVRAAMGEDVYDAMGAAATAGRSRDCRTPVIRDVARVHGGAKDGRAG